MTVLTLNQINNTKDIAVDEVNVPEWGGSVCIKQMTGKERDEYDSIIFKKVDANGKITSTKELRTSLLAIVLCDAKGSPMFPTIKEGINALNKKSGNVIAYLYDKARIFNGITEDEEEVKND